MADDISIKITGLKETQRALYSYSRDLGDRVVLRSLREGAKVVQKSAKQKAPVRTGRLKRGIVIRNSKIHSKRRGRLLGVYLTLRKGKGKSDPKDAFYGRWIEDGWRPHGRGRMIPGKKFIKGAFASMRTAAVNVIVATAKAGAEVVARKTGLK